MTDDLERAMQLLEALCPQHTVNVVRLDGEPASKARPRFTSRGKPYTPVKTTEHENRIAERLEKLDPYPGNVAIACIFYRSSRQRIDSDNMLKAVLDGATKAKVWEDDSQVTAVVGIVDYDPDNPRTIIGLGHHTNTGMTRGDDAKVACEACGKLFFPGGKRREHARWCSRECAAILREPIQCPSCGRDFKRRSGNQKYCSGACRGSAQSRKASLRTHCSKGHELTKDNTYTHGNMRRCRKCQATTARVYRSTQKQYTTNV